MYRNKASAAPATTRRRRTKPGPDDERRVDGRGRPVGAVEPGPGGYDAPAASNASG